VRLATLHDPSGNPQPITTTPQLMNVGATQTRMVYVGTGRYLGESDLSDTQVQTVYALAEDLTLHTNSTDYIANGNAVLPHTGLTLRQQLNQVVLSTVSNSVETKVIDPTTTTVTTVTTPVNGDPATTTTQTYPTSPPAAGTTTVVTNYANRGAAAPACSAAAATMGITCSGWYADLPAAGERVNLDMRLVLGSLIVPTNVTNLQACDIGGNSWLNVFQAGTGAQVPGSPYGAGVYIPGAVTVGLSLIRGQSGRILSVLTRSDDTQRVAEVATQQGAPLGRRTGWRDLLNN
jgi:type IV pilus assembly protein PilY1